MRPRTCTLLALAPCLLAPRAFAWGSAANYDHTAFATAAQGAAADAALG